MVFLNIQLSAYACTGQGSPFHQFPKERLQSPDLSPNLFTASFSFKAVSFLSGCLPLQNSRMGVALIVGGLSSQTFKKSLIKTNATQGRISRLSCLRASRVKGL